MSHVNKISCILVEYSKSNMLRITFGLDIKKEVKLD